MIEVFECLLIAVALASSLWYAWLVWQFHRRPSTLKTYEWADGTLRTRPEGGWQIRSEADQLAQRLGYFEAKVAQLIRITNDILANKGRDALAQRQDKLEADIALIRSTLGGLSGMEKRIREALRKRKKP